jgi:hypothetical protein
MSTNRKLFGHVSRPGWVLAALIAILALVAGAVPAAQAHYGPPTTISASVSSTVRAPAGAPVGAVPDVLVQQGDPFQVTVQLQSSQGHPAFFHRATTIDLTATGPGELSPATVTMPPYASTATFTVSYSTFANAVTVSASAEAGGYGTYGDSAGYGESGEGDGQLTVRPSAPFDVLKSLRIVPSRAGVPFTAAAGDGDCTRTEASQPMCGLAVLPNGATSGVLLSLGACTESTACRSGSLVVQLIADLSSGSSDLYTRAHPATLVIRCDASLCGRRGVPHVPLVASASATGDLSVVEPCRQKGVVNADAAFCTDYRQSHRNRGDLLLYLLFVKDIRAGST